MYDMDTELTAHQASDLVGVSRQLINWWRTSGKLAPVTRAGRSPLYRLGDILAVEAATRRSANSHRAA